MGRFLTWFLGSALLVAAASTLAVFAPPRLKMPLLSAVAWGLFLGWILGEAARGRRVSAVRWVVVLTGVLVILSEIAITRGWQSIYAANNRTREQALRATFDNDPTAAMTRQFESADAPAEPLDPESEAQREKFLAELERIRQVRQAALEPLIHGQTFSGYLSDRINRMARGQEEFDEHAFGRWPHPWPWVFWIGELACGGAAAAWMAGHSCRESKPAPHLESPTDPDFF